MIDDPIVEEIHRVRAKMLEEAGGNLELLMDRLQSRESEDRSRLVSKVEKPHDSHRPVPES
jgi:hypothetical protein